MSVAKKIIETSRVFFGLKNPIPKQGDMWKLPEYKNLPEQMVQVVEVKNEVVTIKMKDGAQIDCELNLFMKLHVFEYSKNHVPEHTQYMPSPLL